MFLTIALCVIGYFAMMAAFCLWDAFIGFPVDEWGRGDTPPLAICAFFWPIAIPIIAIMAFNNFLDSHKEKRVQKERTQAKLRIAAEKEEQRVLRQLERELEGEEENERKNSNCA